MNAEMIRALSTSEWAVLFAGVGLIGLALWKARDRKTRILVICIGLGLALYSLVVKTVLMWR